ncbi:MAG: hypothetical protein M3P24_11810 [Gemmatimonadota bacterium]|nr:hypothetical protein [Gemmatimonadota bacterium]
MKRLPIHALLLAGALGVGGCTDGPFQSPKELTPAADYARYEAYEQVLNEGSFSSYEVETTFVMQEGEYVDLDGADVNLEQTFNERHVWQNDAYDATLAFPSPDRPFGPDYPLENDVGQVYVNTDGEPTVYSREGTLLAISDEEAAMFASMVDGPPLSKATAARGGSRAPGAAPDRREAVDRLLVTPAGSARTLALLRGSFTEAQGPGGVLRFSRNEGSATVQYTFDPRAGVITDIATHMPGGLQAHSVRHYVAAGRARVLAEERTTMRDPQGRPLAQFALRYRNLSIR